MSLNMITKTLIITNMTCVNCENIIEQELLQAQGISEVKASYSTGTVFVTYDESIISPTKIEEILENSDYYVKKNENKENNQTAKSHQNSDIVSDNPRKTKDNDDYNNPNNDGNKTAKSAHSTGQTDYTNILAVLIIVFAVYMIANRFGILNIFNAFPIAKEGMGYGMLFLIGVLTSVHCVAMCGGICLSQCVLKEHAEGIKQSKFAAMRPSLLYNLGRVISYTIIGGIVGAIGSVVSFSGTMKGIVQILAGVFMVIMGLNMLNIFPWLRKFNPRMPKIFAKKIYARRQSNSPLYIGLLNGLMPCGPLQAMQLYALSTGSPVKGAIAMFLFSVGTVPLMFVFGALSAYLNKRFTAKMMTVSAVLVVVLGVFMFNNGVGLSGITWPSLPTTTSQAQAGSGRVATIEDGVQVVTASLASGRYEAITVQKGIPVKWIIQAGDGDINGCNNSIVVPKLGLKKDLEVGDNVIEFTPKESGVIPYSCWMGMIRSKIVVVDDLADIEGSSVGDTTSDTDNSNETTSGGLEDYNNLLDVEIPTDKVAVAKVENNLQTVEITLDDNGFSPSVVIVQKDLETEWIINGEKTISNSKIIFPYYYAQLEVLKGKNPINFNPNQDFDFYTNDNNYYGYVKVVEDINYIDIEAIKQEVSEYKPSNIEFGSGTGLPSCH